LNNLIIQTVTSCWWAGNRTWGAAAKQFIHFQNR